MFVLDRAELVCERGTKRLMGVAKLDTVTQMHPTRTRPEPTDQPGRPKRHRPAPLTRNVLSSPADSTQVAGAQARLVGAQRSASSTVAPDSLELST